MSTKVGEAFIALTARDVNMTSTFEKARQKLEKETAQVEKRVNQARDNMASAFSRAGNYLTLGLTVPLAMVGKQAYDAYMSFDSLERGLVAVMGSSRAAKSEMAKLKEVALLPGLGLKEAYEGSLNLQAAGFSADMARKSLTAFGNALATVGKGDGTPTFLSHWAKACPLGNVWSMMPVRGSVGQAWLGFQVAVPEKGDGPVPPVNHLLVNQEKLK